MHPFKVSFVTARNMDISNSRILQGTVFPDVSRITGVMAQASSFFLTAPVSRESGKKEDWSRNWNSATRSFFSTSKADIGKKKGILKKTAITREKSKTGNRKAGGVTIARTVSAMTEPGKRAFEKGWDF
jgi:hypothetical protein